MKIQQVKLGLVALIIGFGLVLTQSAFTAKVTTLYVQTTPGVFVNESSAGGSCLPDVPDETCKWVLTPGANPADPASYTPAIGYTDTMWIP